MNGKSMKPSLHSLNKADKKSYGTSEGVDLTCSKGEVCKSLKSLFLYFL